MVSRLDYNRNTDAMNLSSIPFHIIFLAKMSARRVARGQP